MQDQPSPIQTHQLEFKGSGSEYFRIWIVNILLTVCTLYIYSAWAKVRTKRYFYGNTVLNGSSFEYHATGKQLLPGRMIGLLLVALIAFGDVALAGLAGLGYVALFLLTPWALCRSQMFNARMTSYRNVRFGFTGEAKKYYKYILLTPMIPVVLFGCVAAALYFAGAPEAAIFAAAALAVLTFYSVYPWVYGKIMAYTVNQSKYGTSEFKGEISAWKVVGLYSKAVAVSLLIFTVAMALVLFVFSKLGNGTLGEQLLTAGNASTPMLVAFFVSMYAVLMAFGTFMKSLLQARLRNYQFNNTVLDQNFKLSSTVTARKLWWLNISNLGLLLVTLGLAYPWVAVRKARFMANHTQIHSSQSADLFIDTQNAKISAVGEEIGDAFDMDVAAGF